MPDARKFSDAEIERLVKFYEQAEREILDRINRALLRANKTEYLVQMKREIEAILQQLREGNQTWCTEAIPRVYSEGLRNADTMLKDIGASTSAAFGAIHQQAAQVLADNAFQRFEDVVQVIGRQVNDIYRELALENVRGTVVGYDTWKQTARRFREQLAERGVTGFKDRSGKMWNMRTYTEMVARTTTMQAHLEGTANRLVEQGHDLVKVSTHRGACPLCLPWQGKILSITGKTEGYPTLEETKAAGLFHPNCRHAYGLYIDLDKEIGELEGKETTGRKDKGLFPDEIAGVKRGNEMTREEANGKKPNPNFKQGHGYQTNCQSCVVAYEARLRGYNVQALPNVKGSAAEKLLRQTNRAWIDPATGKHPEYMYDDTATTAKKFLSFLENNIKSKQRYTLQFSWKGRNSSGHIVSIDRDTSDKLRIYDPQNGSTYTGGNVAKYLGQIKYTMTVHGHKMPARPKVLRVDDKLFNMDIVNEILEGAQQ
jgi:hypothetical protein